MEYVYDVAGKRLGSLQTTISDQIVARDEGGRIVGSYLMQQDVTRDPAGRIIARGNALRGLLVRR